jgi:hypothetical protein
MALTIDEFHEIWKRMMRGDDITLGELKSIKESEEQVYTFAKSVADELGNAFNNISVRSKSYSVLTSLVDIFIKYNEIPLSEIEYFMETGNSAVVANLIWNDKIPIQFLVDNQYYDRFLNNPTKTDTFLSASEIAYERHYALEERKEEALKYMRSLLNEEEKSLPDSWIWKAFGVN